MAGAFIAVEGPDGAGKTTLAQRLSRRLRREGVDVVEVREPGGTAVAEIARDAALDPELEASPVAELFLILAARADLVTKVIRPALEAGKVVVSDRYELSTRAYQIAGRRLPESAVLAANELATGGLVPDLSIVLDVSEDVGQARLTARGSQPDRIERAGVDAGMNARIARAFAEANGNGVEHLDVGTRSISEVEEAAWALLSARLAALEVIPKSGAGSGEGDRR